MAVLSKVTVLLDASTGRFEGKFRRAQNPVNELGRSIASMTARTVAWSTAAVGAAGVGLRFFLRAQATGGNALGQWARGLNLSGKELATLTLGAKLANIEFLNLTSGLVRQSFVISRVAAGSKEGSGALKLLGIDAKKLNLLRPYQQFLVLSEAIQKVEQEQDQLRIAYDIFGKSGVQLINLLRLGSRALGDIEQKTVEAGTALSNFEIGSLEAVDQKFKLLDESVSGLSKKLAVQLAPVTLFILDNLYGWTVATKDWLITSVDATETVARGMGKMLEFLEAGRKGWYFLKGGVLTFAAGGSFALGLVVKGLTVLSQGMLYLVGGIVTLSKYAWLKFEIGARIATRNTVRFFDEVWTGAKRLWAFLTGSQFDASKSLLGYLTDELDADLQKTRDKLTALSKNPNQGVAGYIKNIINSSGSASTQFLDEMLAATQSFADDAQQAFDTALDPSKQLTNLNGAVDRFFERLRNSANTTAEYLGRNILIDDEMFDPAAALEAMRDIGDEAEDTKDKVESAISPLAEFLSGQISRLPSGGGVTRASQINQLKRIYDARKEAEKAAAKNRLDTSIPIGQGTGETGPFEVTNPELISIREILQSILQQTKDSEFGAVFS